MRNFLFNYILMLIALSFASHAYASDYLVLGVIAKSNELEGVALMKHQTTGKTVAVKVGQMFDQQYTVTRVNRKYILLKQGNEVQKLFVGQAVGSGVKQQTLTASNQTSAVKFNGIERDGNEVKVTASLRDKLIKQDLSKILMQAAAVPFYEAGRLVGFQLMEIEPGSIYEMAGIQNGDIITQINEFQLNDVSMTIKLLHSMKDARSAALHILRNGQANQINLSVQ